MTKQSEDQQQQTDLLKSAIRKVINNPKNSKAAKTAAGLGLTHRRNHVSWKPKVRLPSAESRAD